MKTNLKSTGSESVIFPPNTDWSDTSRYGDFKLLHRGNYADTYRASKAGKYFLLKTPKSDNTEYLNILKREYEISAGLDHPNITSAFTFEYVPDLGPCLIMAYIDGETLTEFLSRKPGFREREKVLLQLLSAVGYLHKRDIIHNDLKPENIIISRQEGNLKLIDFGLGDDQVHYLARTLGCTPSFASPELLSGNRTVDARSDIYSIGRIIRLMFPVGYVRIWKKCTFSNPCMRFKSTDTIARIIRMRKVATVALPLLAIAASIACLIVPDMLKQKEYSSAIVQAENYFKEQCALADIPDDNVPYMSENSYFHIGWNTETRKDSLTSLMDSEIREREIKRNAIAGLDSLYKAYVLKIERAPYKQFAMNDVTAFQLEYEILCKRGVERLGQEQKRAEFAAASAQAKSTFREQLLKKSESKPGMENLSEKERMFYFDLVISRQPYRPYRE